MKPRPASIYSGDVVHVRHAPQRHRLRHGLFSILADIDGAARRDAGIRLFSYDRFNLVSVHASDHGDGSGDLRGWVQRQLREIGLDDPLDRIQLLAAPRVLGLAFNPISVFFAHDRTDRLRGVVFEVSNFHGGRCAYAFAVPDPGAQTHRFACPKRFYVSPFNPVDGEYRFRLMRHGDAYRLGIQLFRNGRCVFGAVHAAQCKPLTTKALAGANLRHPFNTLGVVGAILFEALRLRLKGLVTYAPRRGTIDTQSRSQ